jgi:hypothetical protein
MCTTVALTWRTSPMTENTATFVWRRETPDFAYETDNRGHNW